MRRITGWREEIERALPKGTAHVVGSMTVEEFGLAVKALTARALLAKEKKLPEKDEADQLDDADILIIDSDLTPDPDSNPGPGADEIVPRFLAGRTGSEVARLARAHTKVGVIVVVNEALKKRTFDLTMTRWASSPANLYITAEDVANPRLWLGLADGDYRPSSWPHLLTTASCLAAAVDTFSLGDRVVDVLGLDDEAVGRIGLKQLESLLPDVELHDVTLEHVTSSPIFGSGALPKDQAGDDEILRRIALAGLQRWVERVLLPVQNVFMDLPHLLSNRPWLQVDRGDESGANSIDGRWYGEEPPVAKDAFAEQASALVGRNLWHVGHLPPAPAGGHAGSDDLVVCEDDSLLHFPTDTTEFLSDVDGPYASRYARVFGDGVAYSPRNRLFRA